MASTPTTRLRLNKQGTGDNLDTWGSVANTQVFDLLDEATQGVETIALTGVNLTLTSTNYASDQARNIGFRFTGTGGVSVVYPSVECVKFIRNDSDAAVIFGYVAGSGVTIAAGAAAVVQGDATTMRQVSANPTGAELSALFQATSTSTVAVTNTGDITFTLAETYRAFSPGMRVRAAVTASPGTYIDGTVKTYNGSSTSLVITADGSAGSGSYSAWTISFAQAQVTLPTQTGQSPGFLQTNGTTTSWQLVGKPPTLRTSNSQLTRDDNGKLIIVTSGTFSQTYQQSASLGNGWHVWYCVQGSGTVTHDPNGSETIGGQATCAQYPGELALITCDGSNLSITWFVLNNTTVITSTTTYTPRAGVYRVWRKVVGAGASGGTPALTSNAGYAGGSGAELEGIAAVTPGTAYTATIGAGGASVTGASTAGNAGGSSSFLSATASGGAAAPAGTWSAGSWAAGGTASGSDISVSVSGQIGLPLYVGTAAATPSGSKGGDTSVGRGGARITDQAAVSPSGYGAGGAGGSGVGGVITASQAGTNGVVIVSDMI